MAPMPCLATTPNARVGCRVSTTASARRVSLPVYVTKLPRDALGTNNGGIAFGRADQGLRSRPRYSGRTQTVTRASKGDAPPSAGGFGKFVGGFLLGGAIFGVAGVLFAPQLSKTFLKGKDAAGRFLYDDYESDDDADAALERTRNDLNEKIAQLNAAIDTFSSEAERSSGGGGDGGNGEVGETNGDGDETSDSSSSSGSAETLESSAKR